MFDQVPPELIGTHEWDEFHPFAVVVGNDGLPPEVLRGDIIICRTTRPEKIAQGLLALVNVIHPGGELLLVRRVYTFGDRGVFMPGPTAKDAPVITTHERVKILAPVLELRRRFPEAAT